MAIASRIGSLACVDRSSTRLRRTVSAPAKLGREGGPEEPLPPDQNGAGPGVVTIPGHVPAGHSLFRSLAIASAGANAAGAARESRRRTGAECAGAVPVAAGPAAAGR